jgi:hypothetical protein
LFRFTLSDALQGAQVEQEIDQGVEIGDRGAIELLGALDTRLFGEGIDALCCSALLVELLVGLAVAVQLVANTCADAVARVVERRETNKRLRSTATTATTQSASTKPSPTCLPI